MTKRTHRSAAQWQALINQQLASGQSVTAFCDGQGLSYPVFCKWRKRIASIDASPLIDLSSLVQVPQTIHWDIELDLGCGMTLRLRRG